LGAVTMAGGLWGIDPREPSLRGHAGVSGSAGEERPGSGRLRGYHTISFPRQERSSP
jgi:hypothetical protein